MPSDVIGKLLRIHISSSLHNIDCMHDKARRQKKEKKFSALQYTENEGTQTYGIYTNTSDKTNYLKNKIKRFMCNCLEQSPPLLSTRT